VPKVPLAVLKTPVAVLATPLAVAPVPQATELAPVAVAPSALPVPAWPQTNCAAAGAGASAKKNIESATVAPPQDFIRLDVALVTTRGICALSSKNRPIFVDRLDQYARRTASPIHPRLVKVE
jgi:hypothetical protein